MISPQHRATISAMAEQIRNEMGEDFDHETFMDTLDGATDFVDIIDDLVQRHDDALAFAEAMKRRRDECAERARVLDERAGRFKNLMHHLLDLAKVGKVKAPSATVSIQQGRNKLVLSDDFDVNQQPHNLVRVKREPDKTAISDALSRQVPVRGARLERSSPTLNIRRA